MKTHVYIAVVFVLVAFTQQGKAQDKELLDARFKKYEKPDKSKFSKYRQIFSWDWKFSYATEFTGKPARNYSLIYKPFGDTVTRNSSLTVASLASVGFEPRWNLRQRGKNAFGVKLATHVNWSFVEHPITEGLLHGSQACYLFYGRGYAGPFNDFSARGFAISVGLISVFAPIFSFDGRRKDYLDIYTPLPGSKSITNKMFILPVLQFDLYNNHPLKSRPSVMSVALGYLNGNYMFRFNFGLPR